MTTVQITMADAVVEAAKQRAAAEGKTLDQIVQESLEQRAAAPLSKAWVEEFVRRAKAAKGNSRGWKWNREEIHDA